MAELSFDFQCEDESVLRQEVHMYDNGIFKEAIVVDKDEFVFEYDENEYSDYVSWVRVWFNRTGDSREFPPVNLAGASVEPAEIVVSTSDPTRVPITPTPAKTPGAVLTVKSTTAATTTTTAEETTTTAAETTTTAAETTTTAAETTTTAEETTTTAAETTTTAAETTTTAAETTTTAEETTTTAGG